MAVPIFFFHLPVDLPSVATFNDTNISLASSLTVLVSVMVGIDKGKGGPAFVIHACYHA